MNNKTIVAMSAALFLAGSCSDSQHRPPKEESPQGTIVTFDDHLVSVAKLLPGFGGLFVDEHGDLNVYMVQADDELSAADRASRLARLETVLTAVLEKEILTQGQPPRIKIVKGQYDVSQLATWRVSADTTLEIPGAVFSDLDERHNRLRIGIESSVDRKKVEDTLTKQGVPLEAVIFEIAKPIRFMASLRSKFRPLRGGTQVESDTAIFYATFCTMGFNAIHDNKKGFVTNSHCTSDRGGVEDTEFHQPTDPFNPFADQNFVGEEILDPEYWTASICPAGRVCRTTDSAFVEYDGSGLFGTAIARPTAIGSLEVSTTEPSFTVVGETLFPLDGEGVTLEKVGRTTGWTSGLLSGTCMHTNVADTNVTLLCQYRVLRSSGPLIKIVDQGDSGSPVFRRVSDSGANLYGLLWGGDDEGTRFIFSSMLFLHLDLFPLTASDFPTSRPTPPRPIGCPVGEKCCERAPNGDCELCIPRTAACP
jgi:hypothetical protein